MLTAMRDADANGERMARLVVALHLHQHLQHESPLLFRDITTFASAMEASVQERCQAVAAPLLERMVRIKAGLKDGSLTAEALPGMVNAVVNDAVAAAGKAVPHTEQVCTCVACANTARCIDEVQLQAGPQMSARLQAWCTDGAPVVMTTAAQDELELLLKPLAMHFASLPTFGSAMATAPKVLADIMESLLGAVFLDCGTAPLYIFSVVLRKHMWVDDHSLSSTNRTKPGNVLARDAHDVCGGHEHADQLPAAPSCAAGRAGEQPWPAAAVCRCGNPRGGRPGWSRGNGDYADSHGGGTSGPPRVRSEQAQGAGCSS